MVKVIRGDIFDSPCVALVNPVNCVGVSGAGLAKVFKEKFPNNYRAYRDFCLSGQLRIGKVFVFEENGKVIINCPTKYHWRDKSTLEIVKLGLLAIKNEPVASLALPALGCGLGGLQWDIVKEVIVHELRDRKAELYYR